MKQLILVLFVSISLPAFSRIKPIDRSAYREISKALNSQSFLQWERAEPLIEKYGETPVLNVAIRFNSVFFLGLFHRNKGFNYNSAELNPLLYNCAGPGMFKFLHRIGKNIFPQGVNFTLDQVTKSYAIPHLEETDCAEPHEGRRRPDFKQKLELIEFLYQVGADPNHTMPNGQTHIQYLLASKYLAKPSHIYYRLNKIELIKVFQNAGVDLEHLDREGHNLFDIAVKSALGIGRFLKYEIRNNQYGQFTISFKDEFSQSFYFGQSPRILKDLQELGLTPSSQFKNYDLNHAFEIAVLYFVLPEYLDLLLEQGYSPINSFDFPTQLSFFYRRATSKKASVKEVATKIIRHFDNIPFPTRDGIEDLAYQIVTGLSLGKEFRELAFSKISDLDKRYIYDKENGYDGSLYHLAIQNRADSIVKILLKRNINHTIPDSRGLTPLEFAKLKKRRRVVKWLGAL